MWDAIVAGAISGMILGSLPGGVVFSIIQHSLDLGWKKGVGIASGVVLSDLCLILFVNLSTGGLAKVEKYNGYISLAGVTLLLFMGLASILSKNRTISYPKTKYGGYFYLYGTGFLLNSLNPINFFMWMGITTQIKARDFFSYSNMLLYFIATLIMIFLMLSTVSFFAGKLRKWLTVKRMRYLNIGIGIIFIGLAIKLGFDAYVKHFVL